ncbi:hypothetical protein Aperf_G00000054144 [Anoplocephala perfoliata]
MAEVVPVEVSVDTILETECYKATWMQEQIGGHLEIGFHCQQVYELDRLTDCDNNAFPGDKLQCIVLAISSILFDRASTAIVTCLRGLRLLLLLHQESSQLPRQPLVELDSLVLRIHSDAFTSADCLDIFTTGNQPEIEHYGYPSARSQSSKLWLRNPAPNHWSAVPFRALAEVVPVEVSVDTILETECYKATWMQEQIGGHLEIGFHCQQVYELDRLTDCDNNAFPEDKLQCNSNSRHFLDSI